GRPPRSVMRPSIVLNGGGTVTNGRETNTKASIRGAGIIIGRVGSVTNFGTIAGTAPFGTGVQLWSGTVTNGSATDTTALISGNRYGVSLFAGTVVNWGTISARGAVLFNSSNCTLIQEGTGTLSGKVGGGGGKLELAGGGGPGTLEGVGSAITD